MRKPIIAGNWKMNKTAAECRELITALIPKVKDAKCDVVVCVPFTDIALAAELTKGTNIQVGAQNIAWADSGAFTGEISAAMLKEAGAAYVIIGHSERRQYFGETDKTVNARLTQALKNGLKPIVCVGEMLAEREGGLTEKVCRTQVMGAFDGITAEDAEKVVIAYEPVWAIGTGKTATDEQADETIGYIRSVVKELYGAKVADGMRIQYGGSMNAKNVQGLMAQKQIDGGLIGGASLKADDFSYIVNNAE
ncbi:MAG: triose-phosphate isomerase [Clostridiales bacterium]|nr:triose-phosphate isomerase [Clostridiales bacterium]